MHKWATVASDFVIELFEDGTYKIIKNRYDQTFDSQKMIVYGVLPDKLVRMVNNERRMLMEKKLV